MPAGALSGVDLMTYRDVVRRIWLEQIACSLSGTGPSLEQEIQWLREARIASAMEDADGNITVAAGMLGMNRNTLTYHLAQGKAKAAGAT